jgi:hypothetical protein
LTVLAGGSANRFIPSTPIHLRSARTCYDHLAGHVAVLLRDRLEALQWICADEAGVNSYEVTPKGAKALGTLGIDVDAIRLRRRRFAYACVDWSERRPHIGGALGDALLAVALKQKWFVRDLDSRALRLTLRGRRQMLARFGVET